uniref:Uncharacterized protein n=1 Tax=Setaria italica TaxID=4555 RepID=K4A3P2_SETIT
MNMPRHIGTYLHDIAHVEHMNMPRTCMVFGVVKVFEPTAVSGPEDLGRMPRYVPTWYISFHAFYFIYFW